MISAIRHLNYIDIYLITQDRISHYRANPFTNWFYEHKTILPQYIPVSNISAIRHLDYIDIYFIDSQSRLCHGHANPSTNWEYFGQELVHNVDPTVDPVAIRYQNAIDVYCVTKTNKLVHLYAGDYSNWLYQTQQIRSSKSKIGGISAIRTVQDSIDIYFIEKNTLFHGNSKQFNKWRYVFQSISYGQFQFKTVCTRYKRDIDVFAVLKNGTIVQYFANPRTWWKYNRKQTLSQYTVKSNFFTAIRFQHHMDVYFVDTNLYVRHAYCGQLSNWQWTLPLEISQFQSTSDLRVIRTQVAIDLYYFGKSQKIIHSYIGEGTGINWSKYQSKELQVSKQNSFPTKQILKWKDIKDLCKLIGQGHHGLAYHCKDLNIVLKKYKLPKIKAIKNEVMILDKKSQIGADLCKYILYDGPHIIGFSIKYFSGKSWDKIISQKNSIFHKNPFSKVKLIFKLATKVIEIQKLNICHGDISLDNLIIHVQNQNEVNSQIDVQLIDFGNAIDFSQCDLTHSCLTGWQFLLPPQTYKKPYNPIGVNAYQFGCVCVHILEGITFSQYKNLPKNINQKLNQLKGKYPQQIYDMISQTLSQKVQNRLKTLFNGFNNNKIQILKQKFSAKIQTKFDQKQSKVNLRGKMINQFLKQNNSCQFF